ncbi:MAG: GTP cyclohydrolase I, partial [Cryomorphaceae bacterium]
MEKEDSKHIQKEKELENLESLFDKVLDNLGGERDRQGLENTPLRVAKSMQFLTQGYDEDPCAIIRSAMFDEEYSQMVLV